MSKLTVVYVAGAGRSGSTVLDTVLGSSIDAVSVGELINATKILDTGNEYCACGVLAVECQFWSAVQEEWQSQATLRNFGELGKLQRKFELRRNFAGLYLSKLRHSKLYGQYLRNTGLLYSAIEKVSKKHVIIDSSKSPVRAAALAHNSNIRFCIVHLVRDGRGVAWSLAKALGKDARAGVQNNLEAKPVWRTALYWVLTNFLTEIILRPISGKKYVRVLYEDFVREPEKVLSEISRVAGHDFVGDGARLREGVTISGGHMIAGNRVRMQSMIKLREDRSWMESISRRDRRIFWLIAGFMLRRYGYQR